MNADIYFLHPILLGHPNVEAFAVHGTVSHDKQGAYVVEFDEILSTTIYGGRAWEPAGSAAIKGRVVVEKIIVPTTNVTHIIPRKK